MSTEREPVFCTWRGCVRLFSSSTTILDHQGWITKVAIEFCFLMTWSKYLLLTSWPPYCTLYSDVLHLKHHYWVPSNSLMPGQTETLFLFWFGWNTVLITSMQQHYQGLLSFWNRRPYLFKVGIFRFLFVLVGFYSKAILWCTSLDML